MVEQVKKINNPLTIIAIFAALAEINATVAISFIDKSLHYIFIWFIIGFPTILVILFFVTLNYNTKVMYSPSDYRDDKTFLDSLYGLTGKSSKKVFISTESTSNSLELFEKKVVSIIEEKLSNIQTSKTFTGEEIRTLINNYKKEIKELSEKTIRRTGGIDFDIPQELRNEIIRWISFPAYLPIIYAIIKENITSTQSLDDVSKTYNLPSRWKESGLTGLFDSNIITGPTTDFQINTKMKQSLQKWILLNESVIQEICTVYSKEEIVTRVEISNEARIIAQKLII